MISDQLLFVLKLCLLAVLYLFFFRVVRAVWAELRPSPSVPVPSAAPVPAAAAPAKRDRRAKAKPITAAPCFVILEPAGDAGRTFPLDGEVSIGRAAGCQITLDDTYASQIHARVFIRDNQWQIEDVGSTNGTWLNRQKVSGPMVVQRGDRVQIGNTVLEMQ